MADDKKVQWIQVGTGDDYFMSVSVGEVDRKLRSIGFEVIDAHELATLNGKIEKARNAAGFLCAGDKPNMGLTDEELSTTKNISDLREEYRELQAAFRRVQAALSE